MPPPCLDCFFSGSFALFAGFQGCQEGFGQEIGRGGRGPKSGCHLGFGKVFDASPLLGLLLFRVFCVGKDVEKKLGQWPRFFRNLPKTIKNL